jgi:prepilin-type N-terminal cleavage/methylation domain-containing protein
MFQHHNGESGKGFIPNGMRQSNPRLRGSAFIPNGMRQSNPRLRLGNSAFTLVEVVIVMAIIGIMLPIVFSVLFTVAKQQNKIFRLSEAKQQGDYALNYMKAYIRNNGDSIFQDSDMQIEACTDSVAPDNELTSQGGTTFYLSKKNAVTEFFQFTSEEYQYDSVNDIRYNRLMFNNSGDIQQLTTSTVSIVNFSISCFRRSASSEPFVFISFTIFYKTNLSTAAPEDQAILNYRGIVKMR